MFGFLPGWKLGLNHLVGEASNFVGLLNSHNDAINLNAVIGIPIVGLFFVGGPSAIPRLVVATIVDAVNGVFGRRTLTHVGVESFKGSVPLWGNLYALFDILDRSRASGPVSTPDPHINPSPVGRGSVHAVTAVSFPHLGGFLASFAAAISRIARQKVVFVDQLFGPTNAATKPHLPVRFEDGPKPKDLMLYHGFMEYHVALYGGNHVRI